MPIDVVGLGALNMDHIYRVERILADGEALLLEATSSPGGSAANTIYGLARLGVSTGFCGAIGEDDAGKILLRSFQQAGVDTSAIRVKAGSETGSVLCLSDRLGRRSLYVLPGANNSFSIDDLNLNYFNQAGVLHLTSFAGRAQFELSLELLKNISPSVKLSFAPGMLYAVWGLETLNPIMNRTYLLFVNQGEMRRLTGRAVIAGAERCLRHGCRRVVVTLGKGERLQGKIAVAYDRDTEGEHIIEPTPETEAEVDTTGAGDAFAAGFLYGLLKGKNPEECGRLGNILAQFSVTCIGARDGLPTLSQLAQRYQELYHAPL